MRARRIASGPRGGLRAQLDALVLLGGPAGPGARKVGKELTSHVWLPGSIPGGVYHIDIELNTMSMSISYSVLKTKFWQPFPISIAWDLRRLYISILDPPPSQVAYKRGIFHGTHSSVQARQFHSISHPCTVPVLSHKNEVVKTFVFCGLYSTLQAQGGGLRGGGQRVRGHGARPLPGGDAGRGKPPFA